jgi:hypothetical protein
MPWDFDFNRFEKTLYKAAAEAFREIRRKNANKNFYAYALCTTGLFDSIYPACNADREMPPSPGDWVPEHWAYRDFGKKSFLEANRMLRGMGARLCDLPARELQAAVNRLANGALNVLKRLDRKGAFGKPGERENYVLNLMLDDQDDAGMLATAKKINPPKVVKRLEAELKGKYKAPMGEPKNKIVASRPRQRKGGAVGFQIMDVDYDPNGNSRWHGVGFHPVLADDVLRTPEPLTAKWKPINARIDRAKAAPDIYAAWWTIVNEKALQVFRPFLGKAVEALPLNVPSTAKDVAPLFILHPLGDRVDFGEDVGADAGSASTFVFGRKDIADKHIFKAGIYTFVSDDLRRAIEEAGLLGVRFHKPVYKLRN